MVLRILEKNNLKIFLEALLREYEVIGVVRKKVGTKNLSDSNFFDYSPLEAADELVLDFDLTIQPPKRFLFPPEETIFQFDIKNGKIEAIFEIKPKILFGVHPYDILAINLLDKALKNNEPYQKRRENTLIFGIDPVRVSHFSFWSTMKSDKVEYGYDIMLTDIGNNYVLEAKTEKGEEIIKQVPTWEAFPSEIREREKVRARIKAICDGRRLNFPMEELPLMLDKSYEHPIWERQANKCLACATCNLVCPTCYCYDIQDSLNIDLKTGKRYRIWDACLLKDFAAISGYNFRDNIVDRYRYRFYCKGKYIYERLGMMGCVGCGRCSWQCPTHIADPIEIYNKLKEEI